MKYLGPIIENKYEKSNGVFYCKDKSKGLIMGKSLGFLF